MFVSYTSSTHLILCIQSTSSRTPECFRFHPWNNSPAEWRCTPTADASTECFEENLLPNGVLLPNSAHMSVSSLYQFLVLTYPLQLRDKGDFIPELTTNTRRPQAKSVRHPFFPPLNRWSLHLYPNPSSSIFEASIFKWRTKTKVSR
jgi:hypothetical protein